MFSSNHKFVKCTINDSMMKFKMQDKASMQCRQTIDNVLFTVASCRPLHSDVLDQLCKQQGEFYNLTICSV